jgi:hypothetical protein
LAATLVISATSSSTVAISSSKVKRLAPGIKTFLVNKRIFSAPHLLHSKSERSEKKQNSTLQIN